MKQSEQQIAVVLGMHRSGTSAVARGLSAIGVDLGSRLNPGVAGNNDKGFFEDIDIVAFDDALLHALGHEWQSLAPVAAEELSGPIAQSFKPRAVALLQAKLGGAAVFGVKDPRFPRLLPFWNSVFGQMEVRASYVIVCRNPLSVAHSLAGRDGFDREKSYYLWLEHMLASITHTAGCNRIVVDYDNLMEDAAAQFKRIAGCLALDFDPASPEFREFQDEFLEESLRHTRFDAEDLVSDQAAPKSAVELHLALQELAADRSGFDSPQLSSLLARLSALQAEMRPVLSFMRASDDKVAGAAATVAGLNQELAECDRQAENLQRTAGEWEARCLAIENTLSWRATLPLRALMLRAPRLRAAARGTVEWALRSRAFRRLENRGGDRERPAGGPLFSPSADDCALAMPLSYAPSLANAAPTLAVVCHMFFDDMAGEFKRYLSNIPCQFDLYVTTDTSEKKQKIENAFDGWQRGNVEIRIAPNRGRDIAPKLIACADVYPKYEFVLHIHSKRSPHAGHLAGWRNYLLETLLGSPQIVTGIFEVFEKHPGIGMIAPQHLEGVRAGIGWGRNYKNAEVFAGRFAPRLAISHRVDFPSGSMFWARSAALKPLLNIGLSFDDFPAEQGQTDGTLAHLIERLYFYVCEAAGFDWIKIAQPRLLRDAGHGVIHVQAAEELLNSVATHVVRLSAKERVAPAVGNVAGNPVRRHFVEDNERQVADLLSHHPLDEAMSMAVGGNDVSVYTTIGQRELQLLKNIGLAPGMRLVDMGCGSGRLATALHGTLDISYVGIDIVQSLLDYAKTKAPTYEFVLHRELSIPQPAGSADMICAFSLFTHLLHAETYIYLEDAVRVLKPGGTIVFSFLEFLEPAHWDIFLRTKNAHKVRVPTLDMFIERSVIETWARHLDLTVGQFFSATDAIGNLGGLGQAIVVLRRH